MIRRPSQDWSMLWDLAGRRTFLRSAAGAAA